MKAQAWPTVSACPALGAPRFAMAGILESVESCLERHIPPEELAEVKRILYGGEARCAASLPAPPPRAVWPGPALSSPLERGEESG